MVEKNRNFYDCDGHFYGTSDIFSYLPSRLWKRLERN